jgi:hypothetical protein
VLATLGTTPRDGDRRARDDSAAMVSAGARESLMTPDPEVRKRIARLEAQLGALEALPDGPARVAVVDAMQSVIALYGEALTRVVEHVVTARDSTVWEAIVQDELLSHLLILHDLHPDDPATRAARAVEEVRRVWRTAPEAVEMLAVEADVARVRIKGNGNGLRAAVEAAILGAVPEITTVEITEVDAPAPALVQLSLGGRSSAIEARGA